MSLMVKMGHFRSHGPGEPVDGTLSEMVSVQILDRDDVELVSLILDPRPDGLYVQVDPGNYGSESASEECLLDGAGVEDNRIVFRVRSAGPAETPDFTNVHDIRQGRKR